MVKTLTVTFAAVLIAFGYTRVDGLNQPTHELINQKAIETLLFDSLLRGELGFLFGIEQPFNSREVLDWVGEGGVREDDGVRYLRHFHDPLQPWDDAGLLGQFDSSVRWMQRDDSLQEWSWQQVRASYLTALVTPDTVARQQAWADTFRGLGQVMHLVVDASVPEHTRNDPHPFEGLCRTVGLRCYGSYEYWVTDQHGDAGSTAEDAFVSAYLSSPITFDPGILQEATEDTQAPVPIARLIDTNTYTGADPNVTLSPAIGIAEFSNANFFSEDTSDGSYPFPSVDDLVPSTLPAPKTGRARLYRQKAPGDGLAVDPALAQCVLAEVAGAEGVSAALLKNCVDENVWAATARATLPRALGYARGVLDYFFRGRMEVASPSRFVYGLADYRPGNTGAFTTLRFRVRNATPGEDVGPGQIVAVVQYRTPVNGQSLIDVPIAALSGDLSFSVSKPVDVALTPVFQELTFDFSDQPLPTNSADLFLTVVYKGRLGLEDDAVLVGGKDLFEPDPLDSANITDYDCAQGQPQYVVDLPAYDPPAHVERDVNQDGVQDLFGPLVERTQFIKTFDLAGPVPTLSDQNFDFSIPQLSFAQRARFMLLQDRSTYGVALLNRQLQDISSGASFANYSVAFTFDGLRNDVTVGADGGIIRHLVFSFPFRGSFAMHQMTLANANMAPCVSQAPFLTPDLTFVDGFLPAAQ